MPRATPFATWRDYDRVRDALTAANKGIMAPVDMLGVGRPKGYVIADSTAPVPVSLRGLHYALDVGPADLRRRLVDGDHWLDGAGWIGPHPTETDARQTVVDLAERLLAEQFISKNVLGYGVKTHLGGVLGKEPRFSFSLRNHRALVEPPDDASEDEKAQYRQRRAAVDLALDDLSTLTTAWWDTNAVWGVLRDFARTLLVAERAVMRLYVPEALLETVEFAQEDGSVDRVAIIGNLVRDAATGDAMRTEPFTLQEAFDVLFVDVPSYADAAIITDEDTRYKAGVYVSTRERDGVREQLAEVCFVDPATRLTTIRTISPQGVRDFTFDLGGRLTMFQGTRERFISDQAIRLQMGVNLAETVLARNIVSAGYLERTIMNAELPFDEVDEVDTAGAKTGKTVIRYRPLEFGPNVTNVLTGVEQEDEQGNVSNATPSITYRPPVDTRPTIDAKNAMVADCLDELHLTHVLIAAEATPSGKSREQARAEYESSLGLTRAPLEGGVRWLVETPTAMAEDMANQRGLFTRAFRADATVFVNTGPLTADEQTTQATLRDKALISTETAMTRCGVTDTDAEQRRIDRDPATMFARQLAKGQVFQLFVTQLETEIAARLAKFTDAELQLLMVASTADNDGNGNGNGTGGAGGADTTAERDTQSNGGTRQREPRQRVGTVPRDVAP